MSLERGWKEQKRVEDNMKEEEEQDVELHDGSCMRLNSPR